MNVDIFACINIRGFVKMGNFACIKIHVLNIIGSLGFHKSNFRGVHIFADVKECELRENMYSAIISTFTDISFNITCTLMKFYMPILECIMEGTVSQFFYLGPRFYFMKCRK